jgi:tellurite resistance protein TerC
MDFLFVEVISKPLWLWLMFLTIVVTLMIFDLGVLHKEDHEIGVAESLKLSAFYIAIAVAFGGYIWWAWSNGTLVTTDGTNPVASYFQGYIIEKVLSIDNVFVISLIFGYFAIPRQYQYRALVWGIIGVIILRGIMIAIGAELVSNYKWMTLVFAAFLAFTGIKMLFTQEGETDVSKNPMVGLVARFMNVTKELHGQKFFVRQPHPVTKKMVVLCHAAVCGFGRDQLCRRDLRGRLRAGHFPDHHRHLHRLHRQHHGHPWFACALLCAGRIGSSLPLPEVCLGASLGIHRA